MTVSKAYTLLEAEGVVTRLRGQGMQVNKFRPASGSPLRERQSKWRELARPVVLRARQLGLSDEHIRDLLDKLLREKPFCGRNPLCRRNIDES
jgi:GntR family transcriptional regulator